MARSTTEPHLAEGFPAADFEQWRALVDKALKGADFEKRLVSRTADGLKINPLYTRNDALQSTAGMVPGTPPFTRGTESDARRSRLGHSHVPHRGRSESREQGDPRRSRRRRDVDRTCSSAATDWRRPKRRSEPHSTA